MLFHYPCDSILFLHGGPGQSECLFQHATRLEENFCSFVYYDQCGTGKTQLKNKSIPEDITEEILLTDLKETISYIKEKYHTEKVVLLGHSLGSILGTTYVKRYPYDVCGYVGMGQVISMEKGEKIAYQRLGELIKEANVKKILKLTLHLADIRFI